MNPCSWLNWIRIVKVSDAYMYFFYIINIVASFPKAKENKYGI